MTGSLVSKAAQQGTMMRQHQLQASTHATSAQGDRHPSMQSMLKEDHS